MMKPVIAFLFAVFLVADAAYADINDVTGNQMYYSCTVENNKFEMGVCFGFLAGFANGYTTGTTAAAVKIGPGVATSEEIGDAADSISYFCVPNGVDMLQLRDIFNAYMARHPETRHENAAILTFYAFAEAFPCQE